jgi:4-hydroxy-3-methylbut-2-enyl diphosphate reductase
MIVTIEPKSRPCPGVENAIATAEDVLRRDKPLICIGELIHNRREIDRLKEMGLEIISSEDFDESCSAGKCGESNFLVRTHGEGKAVLDRVRECGLMLVDTTCPIVRHSQQLVEQHAKEGWGIIIAGTPDHPEVKGLLERSGGCGIVISSREEAQERKLEDRSILLAQSTIDVQLFSEIRQILIARLTGLKVMDTACRFIRNRRDDVSHFAAGQSMVFLIGGRNSANCRLLVKTIKETKTPCYHLESPDDFRVEWLKDGQRIGIVGGASTPRWQLEEMKNFLENHFGEKNPKGLINRKGGKFLWWTRKNRTTKP